MCTGAVDQLQKQQYRIVGGTGAVKLCHWMRQKLIHGRPCYKEEFYGVESHRCLQMTPSVNICNFRCLFCWRFHGMSGFEGARCPEPEELLEGCIREQGRLVSGFKGDDRCDPAMWEEARRPNQVAISLSGEPALYPYLGEFIGLCERKGMTTFLVTNGSVPKAIENLSTLPSQLYVTVAAPNRELFDRLCVPRSAGAWDALMATLELMPSLDTRTVIRHTLVDGWNLGWEDAYARLDEIAGPTFIEPKGYVFVGDSRSRMTMDNMPSHSKVREFSEKIAARLSIEVLAERKDSRVVLLGEKSSRLRIV
ncbi:MAG: 4-demethylwyosine synthase TYW1 [Methanobacteriota archaeon]|nr:MAG: 4-demethylwyosine synthase TYW1 [Euryarchaeota archaeon]